MRNAARTTLLPWFEIDPGESTTLLGFVVSSVPHGEGGCTIAVGLCNDDAGLFAGDHNRCDR